MKFLHTWQFPTGLAFLLGAGSFTLDGAGAHWMWRETPAVAGIFLLISLICWVLLTRRVAAHRSHGGA